MTYSDAYLVEKLKEILIRLYPTPQTSPVLIDRNNLQLHRVADAKMDKLRLNYEELEAVGGNNGEEFLAFSVTRGIVKQSTQNPNQSIIEKENGLGVVHNYSGHDDRRSSLVIGNLTLFPMGSSDPDGKTGIGKTLAQNIHEFIQLLRTSMTLPLGSQQTEAVPTVVHDVSGSQFRDTGFLSNTIEPFGGTMNTAESLESAKVMELNLTLDDIIDLNNLLEGSEASLQFKHVLIIICYCVIACVSIAGNILVVQLVIRSRRLHTLTHALLANLAVADLFMATLNIPFSPARVMLTEWPFGSALCHIVPFVQVTSVYVTSITMTVIAVDRYSVIMNPLGTRLQRAQGVMLVIAIWLVSLMLSLPYAVYHKIVPVLTVGMVYRCQAEFGSLSSRRWFTVITFLAQYLIPLVVTTISYVSIMRRLRDRCNFGIGSTTPRQIAAQSKAKKKTIKMLVVTVVFFATAWAPINFYHLITQFSLLRNNSTAILVCHLIAMSSCTVNPFIYCWFNDYFRHEALKWMYCFRTKRCPTIHPGVEVNGILTRADRVFHKQPSTTVAHSATNIRASETSGQYQSQRVLMVQVACNQFSVFQHPPSSPSGCVHQRCEESHGEVIAAKKLNTCVGETSTYDIEMTSVKRESGQTDHMAGKSTPLEGTSAEQREIEHVMVHCNLSEANEIQSQQQESNLFDKVGEEYFGTPIDNV